MKVLVSSALLTGAAIAGDYSLTRTLADAVDYTMLDLTTSGTKWTMSVQSVFDEDTGYNWI